MEEHDPTYLVESEEHGKREDEIDGHSLGRDHLAVGVDRRPREEEAARHWVDGTDDQLRDDLRHLLSGHGDSPVLHTVVYGEELQERSISSVGTNRHFDNLGHNWNCLSCDVRSTRSPLVNPSQYTTLHYTTLHYTTLHYTTLHYTTLHYTTLHYTTLHYTLYTTLHYTTLHYTTLHYTTLHYTTLHYIILHYTIHYTTLQYATLHYTTLRYTTLHYTTLHYTTLLLDRLHIHPLRG